MFLPIGLEARKVKVGGGCHNGSCFASTVVSGRTILRLGASPLVKSVDLCLQRPTTMHFVITYGVRWYGHVLRIVMWEQRSWTVSH